MSAPPPVSRYSDDSHTGSNTFGPMKASLRNHLGEIADEVMKGKLAIARKISAQIQLENDPAKLLELNTKLNDVLISNENLEQVDAKLTKLLEMLKKHFETWSEIQQTRHGHH